jgi:tripartite ATP-independent transporter DctM subunit
VSPLVLGLAIGLATIAVLATGVPVAFGMGFVALVFLGLYDGMVGLESTAETLFSGLNDFTLVSIPMFVMMGAAVASSRAGSDLYEALARWLHRVPGSLVVANIGACALFAALTGSSPATCAAIGKMGIPEMRRRGHAADLATGAIAAGGTLGILIPPSITMILYGIASETSIGRLFLAGVVPGLLLTGLFILWAMFLSWRRGTLAAEMNRRYSLAEHLAVVPRVVPFLLVIAGVVWALYGGIATPSEAAGVGAILCLLLVVLIYRVWRPSGLLPIFRDTLKESVMIMMIIATSILFSYMLSSLYVTQSVAEWIGGLDVNRWVLMLWVNLLLLVAGCFLPPAAIILMTTPILLPIITSAGFDPIWFGVILTLNMELGLITPPVGLNLFVINGIAPDVRLPTILWGSLPFMLCMVVAILLLCLFPGLATWLPDLLMGPALS